MHSLPQTRQAGFPCAALKGVFTGILTGVLVGVSAGLPSAAEDPSAWKYQADLTLDTSPGGANVQGDVRDFPMLVRLTAADFPFSQADGKGRDIRFASPVGKPLRYEIDSWDSAAGTAEIWVAMDTVKGNSKSQHLTMRWGNGGAVDGSDGAAVFASSAGFTAVWHLGGTGPRPNSVAGGNPATPINFQGDQSRRGMIGSADVLSGASGEYLDLGEGYRNFKSGFTFSLWMNPAKGGYDSHILDLGNGSEEDNIVVARNEDTQDLGFFSYDGSDGSDFLSADDFLRTGVWQYLTVTVSDTDVRIYRDGVLVMEDEIPDPIATVTRVQNYLGKSFWKSADTFEGLVDEACLATVARSGNWIKLSYANQKAVQNLVSIRILASCKGAFSASGDTALAEGRTLTLNGIADCATNYWWSNPGDVQTKILDPEVKSLQVLLPRVPADESILYRFSARIGDTVLAQDLIVKVLDRIPDPVFSLPATLAWDGTSPLLLKPAITNLDAIRASDAPVIRFNWTLDSARADTAWMDSALLLKSGPASGSVRVTLCLDNGGTPVCKTTALTAGGSVDVIVKSTGGKTARKSMELFEVNGRRSGSDNSEVHGQQGSLYGRKIGARRS
jgi:hypothetical protein